MRLGVPDRFGPQRGVVDFGVAVPWCDGVDDLSVGENVTVPMEMGLQIPGCLRHSGADDERQLQLIECLEVGPESMPASAATTNGVPASLWRSRKPGDDRHDGGGLGGVAFVAADFQREPGPVHQQPDDNLRIDPPLLPNSRPCAGHPRIRPRSTASSRRKAAGSARRSRRRRRSISRRSIPVFAGPHLDRDGAELCGRTPCLHPDQPAPGRSQLTGRLDDPGDHQIPEHPISDDIETQPVITPPITS